MIKFRHWILIGYWILIIGICPLFAQDSNKLVALTKQIIEAKTNADSYPYFEELKELYFKENKYNEFAEFLKSLVNKKKALEPIVNYYVGFTRYHQLKYLEEAQNWDEYFSLGNAYRDEITQSLQKSISSLEPLDTLSVYSRLILWKFHRDQQDALTESALSDLMNSILDFALVAKNLMPIKEVAVEFSSYGEKAKARELYRIYADKIVTSQIEEGELSKIASDLYKEGNLDLSENIYDVYIERIQKAYPKEKLLPALIALARDFSYKDQGPKDPLYAEKIFKKIEEIGTKDVFGEELIYLRAFNLEKIKEYLPAKEVYADLVARFPKSAYADEANFKIGIIHTYVSRDIKSGRSYFQELAKKEFVSPQVISSLYQLGLLSQWEEDSVVAKDYYDKLIERAKGDFQETVILAKARLKEIDEAMPIEYNLKTFLDVSLKEEYAMFDMAKLDLRASPYRVNKNEGVKITATAYTAESGCMQIELEYLWSGDLGGAKPASTESSFSTQYPHSGTKVLNLVAG